MHKAAIILAGGASSRLGQDKGLLPLAEKPLLRHILDAIASFVEEKIVVVSSKAQTHSYSNVAGADVKVLIDAEDLHSPLIGAFTGFEEAHSEYSLLLACDTPLLSKDILSLLFELCINKAAAIPRWSNGYTEPLQAVYNTKMALEATKIALKEGKLNMQSMVDRLHGVRYVSTLVLQQLDPGLQTFFNINTQLDLKKAEAMLKQSMVKTSRRKG